MAQRDDLKHTFPKEINKGLNIVWIYDNKACALLLLQFTILTIWNKRKGDIHLYKKAKGGV